MGGCVTQAIRHPFPPSKYDVQRLTHTHSRTTVPQTWKHSDGFAMGKSDLRPGRNTMDTIGRDLYGELALAVRKAGLRMGIFYEMEDYAGLCEDSYGPGCGFGCSGCVGAPVSFKCPSDPRYVEKFLVRRESP